MNLISLSGCLSIAARAPASLRKSSYMPILAAADREISNGSSTNVPFNAPAMWFRLSRWTSSSTTFMGISAGLKCEKCGMEA